MNRPHWVILIMVLMDAVGGALGMKLIPADFHADQWATLAVMVASNTLALFGYPLIAGKSITPSPEAKS